MGDSKRLDFTIVTPSYNYVDYVRECLDSVKAQEGVSYEHLVYDAGSTDGSLEILNQYSGIDLIVEADGGMSEAINKGFRRARGEWVIWLNTDDRLLSGALAEVKKFAKSQEDADVIHGGWNFVDGNGALLRRGNSIPFHQLLFSHLGCYIASTATFFRNDTVIKEGFILNERFRYVMDGEYYNRLGKAGKKFSYFPSVLADFRVHGGNLSMDFGDFKDIDQSLTRQLAAAESIAIRRAYGVTFFKNWHANAVFDAGLYILASVIKQPLKIFHKAKPI